MTRTSTRPTTAVTAPSFLVYPLPSIADETFLQLIFRQHVKRSLFFGFGRSRMAVVEVSSADVAQAVLTAMAGGATAEASHQAAKKAKKEETTEAEAERDVTDMTLADMFAAPTTIGDADNHSDQRDVHNTVLAVNTSEDFSHLPCLAYRGRPVHVVVSGVRVADFYAGGGAVPEKHEDKEERSNAKKKARKEKAPKEDDDATPVVPRAPKVSAFPKNACQKCGSLDHFTRNCDGSGAASAAAEPPAGTEGVDSAAPSSSAPAPAASAAAVSAARSAASFPKECCQKCGSPNHFTRHCDGSGAAATAHTATPSVAAAVSAPQLPVEEVVRTAPAPMPRPAGAAPAPVVQRTSKDQCKHCGSDSHLSRHCPNK